MPDYNSINCPICDKRFTPEDDIVVCPECGAPHHRACWMENGACQFNELHSEGFVWKRPDVEKKSEQSAGGESTEAPTVCASCGTVNENGRFFCKKCGALLNKNEETRRPADYINSDTSFDDDDEDGRDGNPFRDTDPYALFVDPLGGVPPEEDFDGVQAKELADFVGRQSSYFLRVFKMLKVKKSKVFFNLSAFLFSGFWLLSKKMYGLGAAVTALLLALRGTIAFLDARFYEPIYEQVKGLTYAEQLGYFNGLSRRDLLAGIILPSALQFLVWGIMIFFGLYANNLYKKHCQKSIKRARNSGNTAQNVIEKKGGTNMLCALSVAVSFYIILMFLQNMLY
ncbi:MAG: DUF2628 domain-containing protein [Clostridia bacterium]|nr:DUF2628 domain-containing protein [Clostridia bacterium]